MALVRLSVSPSVFPSIYAGRAYQTACILHTDAVAAPAVTIAWLLQGAGIYFRPTKLTSVKAIRLCPTYPSLSRMAAILYATLAKSYPCPLYSDPGGNRNAGRTRCMKCESTYSVLRIDVVSWKQQNCGTGLGVECKVTLCRTP